MSDLNTNATAGVLAAIAAPFFMTLGFIVWDIEWKKAGGSAFALNMFKCNLASLAFLIMCGIVGFTNGGNSSQSDGMVINDRNDIFTGQNVGFLLLSSFIGIVVGDSAWLEALRLLGATRVLVVDTVKPFIAAGFGRWILDEQVNPIIFLGMVLTIFGVLLVSLEKEKGNDCKGEVEVDPSIEDADKDLEINPDRGQSETNLPDSSSDTLTTNSKQPTVSLFEEYTQKNSKAGMIRGYVLAVFNVLLDTYGSILTKQFGLGMTTWAINLIRFGFAGFLMLSCSFSLTVFHKYCSIKNLESTQKEDNSRRDSNVPIEGEPIDEVLWYRLPKMNLKQWGKICAGVALVTFICPALSNYALFQIAIALAITLGSLTPLYALILERLLKGKQATLRAIVGALLAVSGVIILSIWKS